jgi:hypothetical protein
MYNQLSNKRNSKTITTNSLSLEQHGYMLEGKDEQ